MPHQRYGIPAAIAIASTLAATYGFTAQASIPEAFASKKSSEYAAEQHTAPQRLSPDDKQPIDRSGKSRVGIGSFYAQSFFGKKMADGKKMDPEHDNAASRTLPLGTTAKVTNLETGKSAFVTIHDRGPYVNGRIVDLSPSTAREIGITPNKGIARVEVAPLAVPLPNGGVKIGAAGLALLARNDRAPRAFPPIGW